MGSKWFEEREQVADQILRTSNKHTLICGKSGSGKSSTAEHYLTLHYPKHKCIDLWDDSGRYENMLYGLPESDAFLKTRIKELSNGRLEARGFPLEIIVPSGRLLSSRRRLPKCIRVCSFDIKKINIEEFGYLFGGSETTQSVISYIIFTYGNFNLIELKEFLEEKASEDKNISAMSRFKLLRLISQLLISGMFNDNYPPINFKEILKDTKTITSFSSFPLLDDVEKSLFYSLLLKEVLEAKRRGEVKNPIMIYIREISNMVGRFAPDTYEFFQRQLLRIIREGRDLRVSLLADVQRVVDLPPVFRRQFSKTILLKSDRSDANVLLEIGDIPENVLKKLSKAGVGQGIICTGNAYYFPVWFPPARNYHKKPGQDVLAFLSKIYGTYKINHQTISKIKKSDSLLLDNKKSDSPQNKKFFEGGGAIEM